MVSCREMATMLRAFVLRPPREAAREMSLEAATAQWNLGPVEDDHNDNDWRADGTQAVNWRFKVGGQEFLVTVEDITQNHG